MTHDPFIHKFEGTIDNSDDAKSAFDFVAAHYTKEDIEDCVKHCYRYTFGNPAPSTSRIDGINQTFGKNGIYGFVFFLLIDGGIIRLLDEYENLCMSHYGFKVKNRITSEHLAAIKELVSCYGAARVVAEVEVLRFADQV